MAAPVNSGYLQSNDPTKPRSHAAVPFRDIIPSATHPRIAGIADHDALSWCESRRQIEAPAWLINRLDKKNLEQPYKGFTSDGKVREGLYEYAEEEGAPTEQVIAKTEALIKILSEEQKKAVHCGDVTDDEFRLWSNPELYMNPGTQSARFAFANEILTATQADSDLTNAPQKFKPLSTQYSNPPRRNKAMKRSSVAASQTTSSDTSSTAKRS